MARLLRSRRGAGPIGAPQDQLGPNAPNSNSTGRIPARSRGREGHQTACARLHFGTMTPRTPVPMTAPEPRAACRGTRAARLPRARMPRLTRSSEARTASTPEDATALGGGARGGGPHHSREDPAPHQGAGTAGSGSAPAGKRKLSLRMPPPGQTELRAHHGSLLGVGGGAAQEAPLGVPAADGARDARAAWSAPPCFKPYRVHIKTAFRSGQNRRRARVVIIDVLIGVAVVRPGVRLLHN